MWPAILPPPERKSLQLGWLETRRRRAGDGGPPGYRRRFSQAGRPLSAQFYLTAVQNDAFEDFFVDDIASGTLPFWMDDYLQAGRPLVTAGGFPILTTSGLPLTVASRNLVIFGETLPVIQRVGLEYQLTVDLVILP